ncbi:MAG: DUF6785 family protein, partial [Planctomycetota bacterium]
VCLVLIIDPRESLMPFMVTALKITDDQRIKPSKMGLGAIAVFIAGLTVAVPAVFWANYNYGAQSKDKWVMKKVPQMNFNQAEKTVTELTNAGTLADSEAFTTWERITRIRPEPQYLWSVGIGVALVLILSVLRLRFTWWPLHPVLFLVWNTYPLTHHYAVSFLIGWFIKMVVTKIGGAQKYRQFKPLMIGFIAGDLLGGLLFMAHGAIYYASYGLIPKEYMLFEGIR